MITQMEVNDAMIALLQEGLVIAVRIDGEVRFTGADQRQAWAHCLMPTDEAIAYLRRDNELCAAPFN